MPGLSARCILFLGSLRVKNEKIVNSYELLPHGVDILHRRDYNKVVKLFRVTQLQEDKNGNQRISHQMFSADAQHGKHRLLRGGA